MRQEKRSEPDGSSTVYTYDDAGRSVRTTDYDADGTVTVDIAYERSQAGEVTGWTVFMPAGVVFKRFERHVDARGLEEVRQFDREGRLELHTREIDDERGLRVVHYDCDGNELPA